MRVMAKLDDRSPSVELTEESLARLAAAFDRDGVVSASLIGSQATGAAGPLSDIDLAVWLDPELDRGLDLQLNLIATASRALATDEVDLVILNDAPPLLRQRAIASQRVVLDRDPKARLRLEARALIEYLDTKPLRAELARGLGNRLAEGRFGRP
ncbi:MAG: nucleotidyltransferase domain-containing protein [Solirubrobacterales bacterium]|nr:nucleotidyltransferase domain-containing protein [Solirubrobacterales bacterium]